MFENKMSKIMVHIFIIIYPICVVHTIVVLLLNYILTRLYILITKKCRLYLY